MPRISDFPIKSNPSTAANLSAVDGGENVQIPTSVFAKKTDIPSVSGLASTSYVDTKLQTFCGDLINGMDAEGNTLKVGCAEEADRINRKNVGSATQPVYFSEGVPVATTLATVATSGSYNDLTDKPTIPSGGGSGGGSIIPVDALPTENIDANAIYKVAETDVKVEMYYYRSSNSEVELQDDIFEIVDTLPETGTPCLDFVNYVPEYWYYQKSDGAIYGYADDAVASKGGVPVGWYPIEMVYEFIGSYKGMVSSTSEITEEGNYALVTNLTKTNLYQYINEDYIRIDSLPAATDIEQISPNLYRVNSVISGIAGSWTGTEFINYSDKPQSDMDFYWIVNVVSELPEVGDSLMSADGSYVFYYQGKDGEVYCYLTAEMAAQMDASEGWYPASTIIPMFSLPYCGVVYSLDELDATKNVGVYFVITEAPTRVFNYFIHRGTPRRLEIMTNETLPYNAETSTLTIDLA